MKIYIVLMILISVKLFGQDKGIFNIKTVYTSKHEVSKFVKELDSLNKKEFFEDEKYIAYSFCKGEWGGAVVFKNKHTGIKFICESTCPVTITKFDNKYILTNTLHHLSPSTEILEIIDPEKLNKATQEDQQRTNYEKLAQTGAKKLIDTYDYSTLFTFAYKGKLFHIVSDKEETFIAEIKDGKFLKVQLLCDRRLWTYNPKILKKATKVIVPFYDYNFIGYLEVQNNSINLIFSK